MHPDVREKLEALAAAMEAPAAPKDLYDVDAIAALIQRFHLKHHLIHDGLTEVYATALIRVLAAKAVGREFGMVRTEFRP